ncbi:hypothetical protein NPIL_344182 [Nephila pilipes]|nr:hypothetical protein NPIL_344182 [Nephila pilipes]
MSNREEGDKHLTGLHVLLEASYGQFTSFPDIQSSALNSIINCVSINSLKVDTQNSFIQQRTTYRSIDEWLNKMYKNVQFKNGIVILFNIVFVKKPLVQDSVRALACRALCGLARSEYVKDIMSKLPLVVSGKLLDLVKQPLIQDKAHHAIFCKYVYELIRLIFGASASIHYESSLFGINKSEIAEKTKISYHEEQLLQLILNHLHKKGFNDTVAVLQKEMSKKCQISCNIPVVNSTTFPCKKIPIVSSACRSFGNSKVFRSTSFDSFSRITPIPSIPVTLAAASNKMEVSTMRQNIFNPSKEFQTYTSLDSIVTEYLRKQHAMCKNPMLACPPFDLYAIHKCPEPKNTRNADGNFLVRFQKQQMSYQNGGYGGAALDKKLIYSRYRPIRSFRAEIIGFTACSFMNCLDNGPQPRIMVGTREFIGLSKLRLYNINTGKQELSKDSQLRTITNIESSKHNSLFITSNCGRMGSSELWNTKGNFQKLFHFTGVRHIEFGKRMSSRMVGTKQNAAIVFDTVTCEEVDTYNTVNVGNGYVGNRATFDYSDELILSDGVLWDIRSRNIIHKLDKFNSSFNGLFHPNGREIVCNTEIVSFLSFRL